MLFSFLVDDLAYAHASSMLDDEGKEPVTRQFLIEVAEERLNEDTSAREAGELARADWERKTRQVAEAAAKGEGGVPVQVVSLT